MWDNFQMSRLEFEASILNDEHPSFGFEMFYESAILRGFYPTAKASYSLRVDIPAAYPDAMPKVFVEHPNPLWGHGYLFKINDRAPSHDYHVLSPSSRGEVQICHFPSSNWDATKTLHLVLLKAKLWLDGYEWHLDSSQPICEFFGDCY